MTGLSVGFRTYKVAVCEVAGTRIVDANRPCGSVAAKCVPSELTSTGVSADAAAEGSTASAAATAPAPIAMATRWMMRLLVPVVIMIVTGS